MIGSELDPFFLKIGRIFATFHDVGKMPCVNDMLNNFVSGVLIIMAVIFNNLEGRLSQPFGFLGSIEFSSLRTSSSETTILSKIGGEPAEAVSGIGRLSVSSLQDDVVLM